MTLRVLGVDPGLAHTGWGVIDYTGNSYSHIGHGTIVTRSNMDMGERLSHIYRELSALILEHMPVRMGIEKLFFSKNVTSAIPVAQARGVALLCAAQGNIGIEEFTPAVIKQSVVGSGSANKEQVQKMVEFLLGLNSKPPHHAADALAAAVTCVHYGSVWSTVSAVN